ncbi:MAG: 3-dehydroquinate synthase [Candidatus Omnitrophica bacterium CG11_big_fil_rev_8_21_14_0_20_42_13]|uniref:3-dehydroquinate synthase n=1 Tax=Candidatus Ghiorseimicrobium undicola TaxID=1974746 RepID=A0A2H0M227_9BACT|nr:MAG: 3-dehydroquinate synthase [Candidatus Omnitrophica bacterium CG11_big_fil_rev_8_21_14_0_20_42_13]
MKTVRVDLKQRSYDIIIGHNILPEISGRLKQLNIGKDAVIITNKKIKGLLGGKIGALLKKSAITFRFETVPDSERSKSKEIAFRTIDKISKYARKKEVFIIALGGGVIGDLSGFIASIYKRGLPYIQIPTTLLAQIDSSIGGKVAIDLDYGKNLVGSFYQPAMVICDTSLLQTLPKTEIQSGLSEALKYGMIQDANLFAYIEKKWRDLTRLKTKPVEKVVYKCAAIKAKIVSLDEREKKGLRTILNFGHTVGHAIETAGGFKKYNHGKAVALGMLAAAKISADLKISQAPQLHERLKKILDKIKLPTQLSGVKPNAVFKALEFDKKFIRGKNRFVLPVKTGRVIIKTAIPEETIKESISWLMRK